jgi:hypothetical protein
MVGGTKCRRYVVGKLMKQGRGKAIVIVLAAAAVGALLFLVVSSRNPDAGPAATGPNEDCSDPTYEPDGRSWDQLLPATPVQSSDNCVGYCFNAIVESESDENGRVARVVILEEDGALTRGTVHRSHVSGGARIAAQEGEPVRFACFDSFDDAGTAARFEDCVQMLAPRSDDPGCARASKTIAAVNSSGENEFDMFLFGL